MVWQDLDFDRTIIWSLKHEDVDEALQAESPWEHYENETRKW
jgi:hypothetical protein